MEQNTLTTEKTGGSKYVLIFFIIACILGAPFAYKSFDLLDTPPTDFPIETDIFIESGLTLTEIGELLKEQNVIRSPWYFNYVARNSFPGLFAQAGTYYFETAQTTTEIINVLTQGTHQSPHLRITFPEGFSAKDFLTYLPPSFASSTFDSSVHEGYLFPDTYYIAHDMTLTEIIALMKDNFDEKIAPLQEKIIASGFTEREVIILASIIEREAKDVESKGIVSGILQSRLKIGMPLQVDASFDYLLNKRSDQLTSEDLQLDSPYNTYRNVGLPPGPIANPGLESIMTVLEPTMTEYHYYLTDEDGVFHYARTFEEHKINKERYLR